MSANRTTPSVPPKIPTEGDNSPAEKPTVIPDSRGPDQSIAPEPPLPPPGHPPAHSSTPMPQNQAETSLVEKARIDLDRADEVKGLIDRSDTWEGAVGKIKWVIVMPQPVLLCDVCDVRVSCVKLYQDFSSVMNKIVGAELNQI